MRHMNSSDFWKNFRLGEEVHVAGSFIYNGLRRYHELRLTVVHGPVREVQNPQCAERRRRGGLLRVSGW
jgi:hypothetical protein